MLEEISKEIEHKFTCFVCDYKTCRKSSYDKHILTSKHKNREKGDIKVAKFFIFTCKKCEKMYGSRNGLWKHQKTC
jgi:Zinc finger, C2H2 type